jgi:hypothetical protein
MAGTVTSTAVTHTSIRKLVFAWTSAAGGEADGVSSVALDGQLVGLTTIPAAGGAAPTDNYDVRLLDADGHDVLLGAGLNRDTADTEHVSGASLAAVAGSALTLEVRNAGDAKQGTVIVYVR